ncbi:MAG TPA: STAS domain-containing protein [Candidatus Scatosoma pullicola]|nr:STAS domain-containing protein [Candidatus Scatosoma pullicola]
MNLAAHTAGGVLYIALNGEIDEHSAADARRAADGLLDEHTRAEKVVFDLGQVSFMDSTAIGFLIGRYKKLMRYGIPMYITNPNPAADKILALSGVYTLIPRL